MKIKDLESQIYKLTVGLQEEIRKVEVSRVQIEFLEGSNVKLNERLALEEKNKDNIVKAIAKDKDEVEKNNMNLLRILELKDKTLKAIFNC